jgi:hypothetical protein
MYLHVPNSVVLTHTPSEHANTSCWPGHPDQLLPRCPANCSKAATLVAGDAAALLLFAVIGRINHGEILDWETFNTALPFMLGGGSCGHGSKPHRHPGLMAMQWHPVPTTAEAQLQT